MPAGMRALLEVKFKPSSKADFVGGVHLLWDIRDCARDQILNKAYPLSLTVEPFSSFNKGGGVRAFSNSCG